MLNSKIKKSEARKKFLLLRNSLSKENLVKLSNKIIIKLKESGLLKAKKNICIYCSKNSEVKTLALIEELLKIKTSTKNILVPCIKKEDLIACKVKSLSELKQGKFNVLEPINPQRFKRKIDIFLVPGVAFDLNGNRIGYGKGFYDKLLQNQSGLRVGLCFDRQFTDVLPNDKTDVKMDFIITERRIINCNKK